MAKVRVNKDLKWHLPKKSFMYVGRNWNQPETSKVNRNTCLMRSIELPVGLITFQEMVFFFQSLVTMYIQYGHTGKRNEVQ